MIWLALIILTVLVAIGCIVCGLAMGFMGNTVSAIVLCIIGMLSVLGFIALAAYKI